MQGFSWTPAQDARKPHSVKFHIGLSKWEKLPKSVKDRIKLEAISVYTEPFAFGPLVHIWIR